jgi:hypothetical protein
MSLLDFKTDSNKVADGVWFWYSKNSDGSVPGFLLSRSTRQNIRYAKAIREYQERYNVSDVHQLDEAEAERSMLELFVDSVLLSWQNVQPEDDGVELPYTRENALRLLGNSDWFDLYNDLTVKASKAENFRVAKRE